MNNYNHRPEKIKNTWELKENTEIDMTTTGSPLISDNIQLYATRLLDLGTISDNKFREIFEKIPGSELQHLKDEISSTLQILRELHEPQNLSDYIQANYITKVESLIKQIVAKLEHYEVCSILENVVLPLVHSEKRNIIIDMASGIGRYLDYFSSIFKHVVEIDFLENNIKIAKETHTELCNVEYCIDDVMRVNFKNNNINVAFGNWLLQYLHEDDILTLLSRLNKWLVPGGIVFFHEGIKTNFEGRLPDKKENPAIFRHSVDIYNGWFESCGFNIVQQGYLSTYLHVFNNPNQIYWILQCPKKG